jgi:hypothetical protein
MSLLSIIAPTREDLTSNAIQTLCDLGAAKSVQADPVMHKYVIVAWDGCPERIAIFDREVPHSYMVPKGAICLAAGFILLRKGMLSVPNIGTVMLNRDPRPQDQSALRTFLALNQ